MTDRDAEYRACRRAGGGSRLLLAIVLAAGLGRRKVTSMRLLRPVIATAGAVV